MKWGESNKLETAQIHFSSDVFAAVAVVVAYAHDGNNNVRKYSSQKGQSSAFLQ